MAYDQQLLRELIVRCHQAFKRDFEAALCCMADSPFRPIGNGAENPIRGIAGWTKEAVEEMLHSLQGQGDCWNECHFLQVDRSNNLGLVVTRETEKSGSVSGGKVTQVWLATNTDGEWTIIGGFLPDGKADQRPLRPG